MPSHCGCSQEVAAVRRQLRATSQKVVARLCKMSLARAWAAWVDWVAAQKCKAGKLQLAISAWQTSRLRGALLHWRAQTQVGGSY
jgi:hypothetical protein